MEKGHKLRKVDHINDGIEVLHRHGFLPAEISFLLSIRSKSTVRRTIKKLPRKTQHHGSRGSLVKQGMQRSRDVYQRASGAYHCLQKEGIYNRYFPLMRWFERPRQFHTLRHQSDTSRAEEVAWHLFGYLISLGEGEFSIPSEVEDGSFKPREIVQDSFNPATEPLMHFFADTSALFDLSPAESDPAYICNQFLALWMDFCKHGAFNISNISDNLYCMFCVHIIENMKYNRTSKKIAKEIERHMLSRIKERLGQTHPFSRLAEVWFSSEKQIVVLQEATISTIRALSQCPHKGRGSVGLETPRVGQFLRICLLGREPKAEFESLLAQMLDCNGEMKHLFCLEVEKIPSKIEELFRAFRIGKMHAIGPCLEELAKFEKLAVSLPTRSDEWSGYFLASARAWLRPFLFGLKSGEAISLREVLLMSTRLQNCLDCVTYLDLLTRPRSHFTWVHFLGSSMLNIFQKWRDTESYLPSFKDFHDSESEYCLGHSETFCKESMTQCSFVVLATLWNIWFASVTLCIEPREEYCPFTPAENILEPIPQSLLQTTPALNEPLPLPIVTRNSWSIDKNPSPRERYGRCARSELVGYLAPVSKLQAEEGFFVVKQMLTANLEAEGPSSLVRQIKAMLSLQDKTPQVFPDYFPCWQIPARSPTGKGLESNCEIFETQAGYSGFNWKGLEVYIVSDLSLLHSDGDGDFLVCIDEAAFTDISEDDDGEEDEEQDDDEDESALEEDSQAPGDAVNHRNMNPQIADIDMKDSDIEEVGTQNVQENNGGNQPPEWSIPGWSIHPDLR